MATNFNVEHYAGNPVVYDGLIKKNGVSVTPDDATYVVLTSDASTVLMKLTPGDGITLAKGTIAIDSGTKDTSRWSDHATLIHQLEISIDSKKRMFGDGTITIRAKHTDKTL